MCDSQSVTNGHPQYDPRILELIELSETEGFRLPYRPSEIVQIERMGGVVDLVTGAIYPQRARLQAPTPTAEACAWVEAGEL